MNISYCSSIESHYEMAWSTKMSEVAFDNGPIHELPNQFSILRCPPRVNRDMWTYATRCMSSSADQNAIELHLFSPKPSDDIAELLVATSHYHRTGRPLGVDHTVNFGRPWLPGSICTHGLISLPYLDGPTLEWMNNNGKRVRFLWLVPISRDEAEFARVMGVDALESRFEATQFDYLDPGRSSVV